MSQWTSSFSLIGATGATGPVGPLLPATDHGSYAYYNTSNWVVGSTSVSLGTDAGLMNQGSNSVAIGYKAGETNQPIGSIILNAGATGLNGNDAGFYIKPVREVIPAYQQGLFYDTSSHEVIHNSIITLSSPNTVILAANLVPDQTVTYTIGTSSLRYSDVFIGPGSLNIAGPSNAFATIGTDAQGIIYTEFGFASPYLNVGPAQLTPQAVGGWRIGPTGTQGTPGYDLVAQEIQVNGSGPTGQIYSLLNAPTGPSGPTGPQGAAGANAGITMFLDLSTTTTTLPVTDTITLAPIVTTQTSLTYTFGSDTNAHLVGSFLTPTNLLTYPQFNAGEWELSVFASATQVGNLTFFAKYYSVDADGVTNKTLIADASSSAVIVTSGSATQFNQSIFVSAGSITNISRRLLVELYVQATSNQNNRSITIYFRDNTNTHVFTTFQGTSVVGPTGPTGPAAAGYICQAKLTTDQTIANGADTKVQFTDDYDPNNWWTTSNTFNPTINGYYFISASVWWAACASGSQFTDQTNLQIRKNGTSIGIVQAPLISSVGNSETITKIVQMNGTSDYLDVTVYTANPVSQNIQASNGSWFSAALQ